MSNSKGKQAYRQARAIIRGNGSYGFRIIQAGEAKNALLLVKHGRQDLLALRQAWSGKACSPAQAFMLTLSEPPSMLLRPQAA